MQKGGAVFKLGFWDSLVMRPWHHHHLRPRPEMRPNPDPRARHPDQRPRHRDQRPCPPTLGGAQRGWAPRSAGRDKSSENSPAATADRRPTAKKVRKLLGAGRCLPCRGTACMRCLGTARDVPAAVGLKRRGDLLKRRGRHWRRCCGFCQIQLDFGPPFSYIGRFPG